MSKESTSIWERLFIRIKNGVDKFLYYDNLFDDHVWDIRFSKDKKENIKYKIEKSQFSFSLKTSNDIFKYLWMILLLVSLIWMLVLSRHIGISDREVAQTEYSELLYNHFHHIGDANAYKLHPYANTQAQLVDLLAFSFCKTFHRAKGGN